MNLNKCERCGCFFISESSVCPQCQAKDEQDVSKLKNFMSDADEDISVEALSYSTGVSLKKVNRLLKNKELYTTLTGLGLSSATLNCSGVKQDLNKDSGLNSNTNIKFSL